MRIGIDLGGSHIEVGLIDNDKIIDKRERNFTDEDRSYIQDIIINTSTNMIDELLEKNQVNKSDIDLIGIASPGIISDRAIIKARNLGLENFHLCDEIEKRIRINTKIRNDAKCAGLAEKKYGSLKQYSDSVFVCIGTGIGGAVFLDDKLLKPRRYEGFEIGHMIIEANGRQCTCGKKGCFETYASIKALKKRVTKILGERSDVSGKYLREELLIKDNKEVQDEVENFLNYLSIVLCNLIDMFEPEAICLGGSFAYYEGNPILDRLINKLNEPNCKFSVAEVPDIVTASFKNDAGIIGATIL